MSSVPRSTPHPENVSLLDAALLGRRSFLLLGLATVAAGCSQNRVTSALPGIPWPEHRPQPLPSPAVTGGPAPSTGAPVAPSMPGVLARSAWAKGAPDARNLNPMAPVRYITIHHDGMSVFSATSQEAAAQRIELIRQSHRNKRWGDIGYHFVVDRAGRVWEARPLTYQGAHVSGHNEGNIGVLALGNFDQQSPTDAQVGGVHAHVSVLMRQFGVPASRVRTHQEWAATACPGRAMQAQVARLRHNGLLA